VRWYQRNNTPRLCECVRQRGHGHYDVGLAVASDAGEARTISQGMSSTSKERLMVGQSQPSVKREPDR